MNYRCFGAANGMPGVTLFVTLLHVVQCAQLLDNVVACDIAQDVGNYMRSSVI